MPRPAHHANDYGTSFINPWPSAAAPTWAEVLQANFPLGWYKHGLHTHDKARELKVVTPDWGEASLKTSGLNRGNSIIATWLGHASALVEIPLFEDGEQKIVRLLFDPIFSMRAGPTQYSGVSRMKKSPCQIKDLPGCDAVFISHNHYDHLDESSIRSILKSFPGARYFVPLGIRQWLLSTGVPAASVCELDWWQDREFSLEDFGHRSRLGSEKETILKFSCVPAQHNSGRSPADLGSSLWCGWVVERLLRSRDRTKPEEMRSGVVYHAGDTGYRRTAKSDVVCPAFEEIGKRFGPFDLAFLPIWRGGTLGFISYLGLRLSHHDIPSAVHGSPTDAADMHLSVKARNTIGMHFGTFIGSENESYEAIIEFAQACEDRGIGDLDDGQPEDDQGRAGTLDIGASLAVKIQ